jgi:pimeloyl-ACP methyl ester carboxylesterase
MNGKKLSRVMLSIFRITILIVLATSIPTIFAEAQSGKAKNIVIVHGAFADGSGWKDLFEILSRKGFKVTIVQNPLTSLEDDVAATVRALNRQEGPVVLVGHSYGGAVITQAGVSSKVKALVYVAAFVPDVGETISSLASSIVPHPDNGVLPPDEYGYIYYSQDKFHAGFAAEQKKKTAAFMYASQGPVAVKALLAPIAAAAWRTKPAFGIVATEDKSIDPGLERTMYTRAHAKITEVRGSHTLYMSNPKAVARVIEEAADCNKKKHFSIFSRRNNRCDFNHHQ